jgi:hypothetical protein
LKSSLRISFDLLGVVVVFGVVTVAGFVVSIGMFGVTVHVLVIFISQVDSISPVELTVVSSSKLFVPEALTPVSIFPERSIIPS